MACHVKKCSVWWAASVVVVLTSTGCQSTPTKHLAAINFDDSWQVKAGVSDEQAYSGTLAAKAIGPRDTIAFRFPMHELGMASRLRLGAQVWVGRSAARYPPIVVELWRGQSPIYRHDLRLAEVVKRYDSWVPITSLLILPPNIEPLDELRIALRMNEWNTKVYIDDLTLDKAD